jgi:hypothetical protein
MKNSKKMQQIVAVILTIGLIFLGIKYFLQLTEVIEHFIIHKELANLPSYQRSFLPLSYGLGLVILCPLIKTIFQGNFLKSFYIGRKMKIFLWSIAISTGIVHHLILRDVITLNGWPYIFQYAYLLTLLILVYSLLADLFRKEKIK